MGLMAVWTLQKMPLYIAGAKGITQPYQPKKEEEPVGWTKKRGGACGMDQKKRRSLWEISLASSLIQWLWQSGR